MRSSSLLRASQASTPSLGPAFGTDTARHNLAERCLPGKVLLRKCSS
ncbi:MAG: hypothetical protein WAV07_12225 [Candidatus Contendobacter sp.]